MHLTNISIRLLLLLLLLLLFIFLYFSRTCMKITLCNSSLSCLKKVLLLLFLYPVLFLTFARWDTCIPFSIAAMQNFRSGQFV